MCDLKILNRNYHYNRLAIAQFYGIKVHYFQENGKFYRINAYSGEDKVKFVDKKQMFWDWHNIEYLNILDPNQNSEFLRKKVSANKIKPNTLKELAFFKMYSIKSPITD
jgi:hypothetical protein